MPKVLYEAYAAAAAAERDAWEQVRNHLPGSAGFDAQKWQAWRDAVACAEEARRAFIAAGGSVTDRATAPIPGHL